MDGHESVVAATAARVFEDLCFATVEQADPEAPVRVWDSVSVVGFRGARTGVLVARMAGVNTRQIAEAMLGDDEGITQALEQDALGELCNVLCGNILSSVISSTAEFDLTHPRIVHWHGDTVTGHDPMIAAANGTATRVRLSVDEGTVELVLVLREDATS